MPDWMHEYIVRDRVDEDHFVQMVQHIHTHGYEGKFFTMDITYYDYAGMTYWTMGAPIEETIINCRCRKEDTNEMHLKEGGLPYY